MLRIQEKNFAISFYFIFPLGFLKYTPRINLQSLPSVASEQSSHTEQTEVLTSLASELPSELTHDSPEGKFDS